jgi:DNA-binding HxlR family transcriptional regulator
MEANRRQCSEIGSLALRAIATTCSATRKVLTGQLRELERDQIIARRSFRQRWERVDYQLPHTGETVSINSDGEMGQETQKTHGCERNSRARRQSPHGARTQRAQSLMRHRSIDLANRRSCPQQFQSTAEQREAYIPGGTVVGRCVMENPPRKREVQRLVLRWTLRRLGPAKVLLTSFTGNTGCDNYSAGSE